MSERRKRTARMEVHKDPYMADGRTPRCQAMSKQSRLQCARAATPLQRVCASHGSKTPGAQEKAKLKLLDLVAPAIATLARELTNQQAQPGDRLRAAENILDRAGYGRQMEVGSQEARALLADRLVQLRDRTATPAPPMPPRLQLDRNVIEGEARQDG